MLIISHMSFLACVSCELDLHSAYMQVHAKDRAILERERENFLDQIHTRDEMLKNAHAMHVRVRTSCTVGGASPASSRV